MELKGKKMKLENIPNQPSLAGNRPDHAEIARRAYELYETRGSEPGHELENWLQAEQEVNGYSQMVQGE
jgi:hypothetical protein